MDVMLIEIVARAIYENDREFCKIDSEGLDFELCCDYAKAAITAVREHDAQAEVMRCLGAIRAHDATVVESPQWTPEEMARMLARNSLPIPINMIYDPDDYSHPLSLVGGPRFETGGLKS